MTTTTMAAAKMTFVTVANDNDGCSGDGSDGGGHTYNNQLIAAAAVFNNSF